MKKICLYYNAKNGYYIVPQIRAKDVPVWVSVATSEKVGLDSDEELGKAILKNLDVSESAEAKKLAEAKKNLYWIDLGYKSFGAFSKQHAAIQIESDGEKVFLTKLIRDSKGAYEQSKAEGDSVAFAVGAADMELAIGVKKMLNIASEHPQQNEKSIITLGKNVFKYLEPSAELVDCGDGGTDAYQIYKEESNGNFIAFLIDNGYENLSEVAIRSVLERQFGIFTSFSFDNSDETKIVINGENNKYTIESNIYILQDEYIEIQLYKINGVKSIISDEYHKIIDSVKILR